MRRTGGLLLLLGVAILTVVLPGVLGRSVAGLAQSKAIPAPPLVGTCVSPDSDAPAGRGPWPRSVTVVGCDQDHHAEVAEVVLDGGSFARQSSLGVTEPDVGACGGPVRRYLGQSAAAPDAPAPGRWDPVAVGSISIAGPAPLQRSAGQTWVVCLVGSAQAYRGKVAGAFAAERVLPAELGTCLSEPDPVRYPVMPCGSPHRTEILATTSLDDTDLLGDRLSASCAELARVVTGRRLETTGPADLSAAALLVHFQDGRATPGLPAEAPVRGWAACAVSVAADRALTGSTVGIGNNELRWAR